MKTNQEKVPDKRQIEEAARRIEKYIHRTPVLTSANLDAMFDCKMFFKCENFQKAGAFKSRGAVNAVFLLDENDLRKGVATHSSGNHAAALARAASIKGVDAYIVMPENSSKVKIAAVNNYGGKITFCESNLAARETTFNELIQETGATEIHSYNNYNIIAGQATAAKELIEDTGFLDIIMAPVGGGGLLSGTALSSFYFSNKTSVVAAEPENANDAWQSFKSKNFIPSVNPDTIADGLRTSLGDRTFPIILRYVNEILTVSEANIVKAMRLVWERMKIIIEPSSAVPLAAIIQHPEFFRQKTIGMIISGGNVDLDHLPW